MNQRMRLSWMGLCCGIFVVLIQAEPGTFCNLTVINNASETICIKYRRSSGGQNLSKLLESGEQLYFGKIAQASLSAAGIFGNYMAPKPVTFFPPEKFQLTEEREPLIVRINGIKNRSITQPFGEWNIERVSFPLPIIVLLPYERALEAFPTVIKKLVPTPRFILGLPEDATIADVLDTSNMLFNKWRSVKASSPREVTMKNNIIKMIEEARMAFEQGQADVPLHGMASKGISELTTTD